MFFMFTTMNLKSANEMRENGGFPGYLGAILLLIFLPTSILKDLFFLIIFILSGEFFREWFDKK